MQKKSGLNFKKLETESSVPLWLMEMPFSKTVSAGVLILSGTRDEEWPKEAGMAHALEHMFFQGTKMFPGSKEVSGYLEEVGGRINAWTSKEMTFYHAHAPAEHKERTVHILSEQLRNSIFPEEKIPVEMSNIIQEIRRANDNPEVYAGFLANLNLYGRHSLAKRTLGIEESVTAFGREDFISFQRRHYNSSKFVFVVAGGIKAGEAAELFNKYFPEKTEEKIKERQTEKLSGEGQRLNVKKKDIEQVHLFLSATTGKAKDKETLHLEFFRSMISGGMSFPLFQEVRDKRGLCYAISAGFVPWSDVGNFGVYIGTDPKRYKEAIDASLDVIEKSKKDEALLEKVKQLKIGRLVFRFETASDIIRGAADDIAFYGAPRGYDELLDEIKEVMPLDIEKAVDKYLKPEMFYTTMLAPKDFRE